MFDGGDHQVRSTSLEVNSGKRAVVPTEVADKLKALEREVRELRRANEILREASESMTSGTIISYLLKNYRIGEVEKGWQEMVVEAKRLATLKGYGILDTPNEPAFDRLVNEVRDTFGVASALVSFIDEERQWYKARAGVEAKEVPRSISFCTHSIEKDAVTVLLDASKDPRFCKNPFVAMQGGVRFYAAAPIKMLNRARVGTVCIFDPAARTNFAPRQQLQLSSFAAQVVELLIERKNRLCQTKPTERSLAD